MASDSDKKIILLYVLDILKDFTDEQHLLTYSDIISKLDIIYGIRPNIKSIARNIETLSEYGYQINKCGKNGCYLAKRDFDNGEVMYLVDAIFSAKSIPSNEAKELIKKITKNCSTYERRKYKHLYKVDDIARTKNEQLFDTIELLDRAIEQRKKVSFQYSEYDTTKQFLPRMQGRQFIMNPYFLVNNRGKYYLVCNYDKYDNLANYKIECISNIKMLDEDIKPLESLPNLEDFSIQQYINEHIYMMIGQSVHVTLKLDDQKTINDIIDWFGDKINIKQEDDLILADFKVNEKAIAYWALQYGEHVEVIKPASTIKLIKSMLKTMQDKYETEGV